MKVLALGEFPIDSPRAHAVNVFKTAGGFARLGHEVTLACLPPEQARSAIDLGGGFGERGLRTLVLAKDRYGEDAAVLARSLGAHAVYARSFRGASACARAGFCTILETHAHPDDANPLIRECCALAEAGGGLGGIATIGTVLREALIARGADPGRVHIVPDGVDVELFAPPAPLPDPMWRSDGRKHAVYAGHLYEYKGVPTMLEAAELLPAWVFHFVGGVKEDIDSVAQRVEARGLSNVRLEGHRPHTEVPRWLWHADALLLPPLPTDPSARWTSPVKLGEYLAAGPAVIASDIPSLGAWVSDREVIWFRAGDAGSLAAALGRAAAASAGERSTRKSAALELARMYDYANRARRLLGILGLKEPP